MSVRRSAKRAGKGDALTPLNAAPSKVPDSMKDARLRAISGGVRAAPRPALVRLPPAAEFVQLLNTRHTRTEVFAVDHRSKHLPARPWWAFACSDNGFWRGRHGTEHADPPRDVHEYVVPKSRRRGQAELAQACAVDRVHFPEQLLLAHELQLLLD